MKVLLRNWIFTPFHQHTRERCTAKCVVSSHVAQEMERSAQQGAQCRKGEVAELVRHNAAVAQLAINPGPRRGWSPCLSHHSLLPQGLNEDLTSDMLPSLPQVDVICDVLCMQSLVYRQDNFIKVLAPIRHYVRDSLQAPDSTCCKRYTPSTITLSNSVHHNTTTMLISLSWIT